MVKEMATRDTAQVVRLIGIGLSGLLLLCQFLIALSFVPFFYFTLVWFFFGLLPPIVVYASNRKGNHIFAGALLVIPGVFSLYFFLVCLMTLFYTYSFFLLGGCILIVAGGLVASYSPIFGAH